MSVDISDKEDGTREAWTFTGRMSDQELRAAAEIPETWETIEFKANKWDAYGGEEVGVLDMWQAKGRYGPPRHEVQGFESLINRLEEVAGELGPIKAATCRPDPVGNLLEIAPVDLHLGMYSLASHTGSPYDIDRATELYVGAVKELLVRAAPFKPQKIAFVFGNDFLHVDGLTHMTTAGTPQAETSGTFYEMVSRGFEATILVIEMCLKVCPVDIIVVAGNHDKLAAWFLGQMLKTWFRHHDDVYVDDSPSLTKYYKWGKNLIGLNHGKLPAKEFKQLALQMASDVPDLWADSEFREWHVGHKHSSSYEEIKGVRVRMLPSLVPANIWHDDNNYRGQRRACEAYIWGHRTGPLGHLSINFSSETEELL